jgi:RNA-directed DNA polymerase
MYNNFIFWSSGKSLGGGGNLSGMAVCMHSYQDIISLENLLEAWKEFVCGKRNKKDVELFQRHLMSNIISLHADLDSKKYKHSPYEAFSISDPKPRNIHKASVRNRLLHHAIYRKLYPYFDKQFIHDSYSCRLDKGTHKALIQFKRFANKVSCNHTKTVWILKCDVRKFFASIDQDILLVILRKHIVDDNIFLLLQVIIQSFQSTGIGKGLPLGNLTSQLLVNIYMNEFDQYMKRVLKAKYYIRYADDFVILSRDKKHLEDILTEIEKFLIEKLKLQLHPDKVFIKTLASGVDFLGWVHFSKHKILRTVTKKRMFKKLKGKPKEETVQSYFGLLSHGDTYKITEQVKDMNFLDTM